MATLRGLPGTKTEKEAEFVRSASAAIHCLQNGGAATAAGDNGALNVWIDDDGKYRCTFYRYQLTQNAEIFDSLNKVRSWLREWMPALR